MLYNIQRYAIIIVGLILAALELKLYFKYARQFIKILYAFMGMYWAIYYLYVTFRPVFGWTYVAHSDFVRPGILFMISLLLARAIKRLRMLKNV